MTNATVFFATVNVDVGSHCDCGACGMCPPIARMSFDQMRYNLNCCVSIQISIILIKDVYHKSRRYAILDTILTFLKYHLLPSYD